MKNQYQQQAFSLVELLVVLAVVGILLSIAASNLNNIYLSGGISEAVSLVNGQLKLANQIAPVKNRELEIRFYKFATDSHTAAAFRALQIIERNPVIDPDAPGYTTPGTPTFDPITTAADRVRYLPEGIVFVDDKTLSPLIAEASRQVGTQPVTIGDDIDATYTYFRIKPDGSTDLNSEQAWYLTIANEIEVERGLNNFATLEIYPETGQTVWMRP